MTTPSISLATQLACAKRELHLRCTHYPRWVASGRLTQTQAAREIASMQAIVSTLWALVDAETETHQLPLDMGA